MGVCVGGIIFFFFFFFFLAEGLNFTAVRYFLIFMAGAFVTM